MITLVEFIASYAALLFALLLFFIRIEHRLTKIETKLDLHLEHQSKRQIP